MQMFYAEQPVDWLMVSFRMSMGQRQPMLIKPTLFQHFGVKSSFDTTRDNNLKDRSDICQTQATLSRFTVVVQIAEREAAF